MGILIENFEDFSELYLNFVKNNNIENENKWSTKLESLNYLKKDLISLYEVMHKFNNDIFEQFGINISRIRTISGLAFLIFTSKFYKPKKSKIYFTYGSIEKKSGR